MCESTKDEHFWVPSVSAKFSCEGQILRFLGTCNSHEVSGKGQRGAVKWGSGAAAEVKASKSRTGLTLTARMMLRREPNTPANKHLQPKNTCHPKWYYHIVALLITRQIWCMKNTCIPMTRLTETKWDRQRRKPPQFLPSAAYAAGCAQDSKHLRNFLACMDSYSANNMFLIQSPKYIRVRHFNMFSGGHSAAQRKGRLRLEKLQSKHVNITYLVSL